MTELAKALASYVLNIEEAFVRIVTSKYTGKHAISRLTGAQAGFPGSFLNQNSQAGCTRFGTGNNLMP